MSFTSRLSNGWTIAMSSFKVLGANKHLIIFPVMSGISMLLILGSFVLVLFNATGWDLNSLPHVGRATGYGIIFLFYLINYFIVVFFNMALIHCSKLYFEGKEASLKEGIAFSFSRIGAIFSWAVLAAVVGTILKVIQENTGTIGKILIGLVGIVWSVATFFVVPVIAYENAGPIKALERSVQIIKEKWGEGLGAGFNFFLVHVTGLLLFVLPLFLIGFLIGPLVGILFGVVGLLLLTAVLSAVKTIFVSAVYHHINGDIQTHMDQQLVDSLFVAKK